MDHFKSKLHNNSLRVLTKITTETNFIYNLVQFFEVQSDLMLNQNICPEKYTLNVFMVK